MHTLLEEGCIQEPPPKSSSYLKSADRRVKTRETREGWPRLNVLTKVNGDSKSTNERGPSLVGWFVGLVVLVQEIFVLPWLL